MDAVISKYRDKFRIKCGILLKSTEAFCGHGSQWLPCPNTPDSTLLTVFLLLLSVFCHFWAIRLVIVLSHFSRVRLFVNLWIVVRQAPLSMWFSRQEYWSGLPFPPPETWYYLETFPLCIHKAPSFSAFKSAVKWYFQGEDFFIHYLVTSHSSVLAWRIPGMGEPGGLPSMGST